MMLQLGKLVLIFTGIGIVILAWVSQDVSFGLSGIAAILLAIFVQLQELITKE